MTGPTRRALAVSYTVGAAQFGSINPGSLRSEPCMLGSLWWSPASTNATR